MYIHTNLHTWAQTRNKLTYMDSHVHIHKLTYMYSHVHTHKLTYMGSNTNQALKEELQKLGLKCGGTLEQRAKRLFDTKGKDSLSEIDPAHIAGVATNGAKKNGISKEDIRKSKRQLL